MLGSGDGSTQTIPDNIPHSWLSTVGRPRAVCGYTVRCLLGLLLVCAGAMTAYDGYDVASTVGVSEFSVWLKIVSVGSEVVLGLWLMSGVWPRVSSFASLLAFSGFAAWSAYSTLRGSSSCGCFGRVEVAPLATLSLDLTAVVLLAVYSPTLTVSAGLSRVAFLWQRLMSAFAFGRYWPELALASLVFIGIYMNGAWLLSSSQGQVLVIEPVGTVAIARKQDASLPQTCYIRLANMGNEPLKIVGISIRCGISTPTVFPLTINGGAEELLPIRIVGCPISPADAKLKFWLYTDSGATREVQIPISECP